jgi:hypothetical protein
MQWFRTSLSQRLVFWAILYFDKNIQNPVGPLKQKTATSLYKPQLTQRRSGDISLHQAFAKASEAKVWGTPRPVLRLNPSDTRKISWAAFGSKLWEIFWDFELDSHGKLYKIIWNHANII